MKTLMEELRQSGFENEFVPTELKPEDNLKVVLASAQKTFDQIRLGSELAEAFIDDETQLPASLLNLLAADAFVPEFGQWWPRCFFYEGVTRTIVRDLKNIDLRGGVFVMGATWQTRVLVAAMTRVGFNKIILSDIDEERGSKMLTQLQRLNFGVTFQYVPKSLVTQLPGTNSIAANVLSLVEVPALISELSYLNFLKPEGVWIETIPYPDGSPLTSEAVGIGTQVEPALHLLSNVDAAWAEHCFEVKIDLNRYREALALSLKNQK